MDIFSSSAADLRCFGILSIHQQGGNLGVGRKVGPPVERGKFDDEIYVDLLWVHTFDQFICGSHGAAGSEHIVMYHHHIVRGYGITVDLYGVLSIFLVVGCAYRVGGELARLAYGHESGTKLKSEYGSSDKSTRLYAHYLSNAFVAIKLRQVPAYDVQATGIFEQCGQVTKYDTLLREVIYVTDVRFQVFY